MAATPSTAARPPKAPPPRHLLNANLEKAAEAAALRAQISRFGRSQNLQLNIVNALQQLPKEALKIIESIEARRNDDLSGFIHAKYVADPNTFVVTQLRVAALRCGENDLAATLNLWNTGAPPRTVPPRPVPACPPQNLQPRSYVPPVPLPVLPGRVAPRAAAPVAGTHPYIGGEGAASEATLLQATSKAPPGPPAQVPSLGVPSTATTQAPSIALSQEPTGRAAGSSSGRTSRWDPEGNSQRSQASDLKPPPPAPRHLKPPAIKPLEPWEIAPVTPWSIAPDSGASAAAAMPAAATSDGKASDSKTSDNKASDSKPSAAPPPKHAVKSGSAAKPPWMAQSAPVFPNPWQYAANPWAAAAAASNPWAAAAYEQGRIQAAAMQASIQKKEKKKKRKAKDASRSRSKKKRRTRHLSSSSGSACDSTRLAKKRPTGPEPLPRSDRFIADLSPFREHDRSTSKSAQGALPDKRAQLDRSRTRGGDRADNHGVTRTEKSVSEVQDRSPEFEEVPASGVWASDGCTHPVEDPYMEHLFDKAVDFSVASVDANDESDVIVDSAHAAETWIQTFAAQHKVFDKGVEVIEKLKHLTEHNENKYGAYCTRVKEYLENNGSAVASTSADGEEDEDAAAEWPEGSAERTLYDWLCDLDSGRGKLLQYFDVLRQEFSCDLSRIKEMKLSTPCAAGVIGTIDTYFWELCGVRQMGHRLVLAKGINALES